MNTYLDYTSLLSDSFDLYYAWKDLQYGEHQWYVLGVDRSNIDQKITDYFKERV